MKDGIGLGMPEWWSESETGKGGELFVHYSSLPHRFIKGPGL